MTPLPDPFARCCPRFSRTFFGKDRKLKVRSTSRDIVISTQYTWTDAGLHLKGEKQIKWTDYGVPDPSIVISILYPEVAVNFDLMLREGL